MSLTYAAPPSRLDASHAPGLGGNHPPKGYARVCLECGEPYEADKAFGVFCCPGHRKAWNNRRMVRGAELYDLFMALRYQRGLAQLLGLWRLTCRLAAAFRDEDRAERAGRQSWRDPKAVLESRPWLFATRMTSRGKGRS